MIVQLDPRTDELWQHLVKYQRSSVFHSSEWLQVLGDTYGFDIRAYVLLDGFGQPQAGIPFARISDMLGERLISLPFSDYCDPLVDDVDEWDKLIGSLLEEQRPITLRCLHYRQPLEDKRFILTKQALWHAMDLRPNLDEIWRRLDGAARRSIHKAQRHGVSVQAANDCAELAAFFSMHTWVRKYKYHLLAQPFSFFEAIWNQFIATGRGKLLLARYNEQLIGAVLFVEWKNILYYKFNASSGTDLAHRPNDLLLWEGIQYGKAAGCVQMDFGLSDLDQPGLIRYKRKYADNEQLISFLRHWPRENSSIQECQVREMLGQMTQLLTDPEVPDHITNQAAEALYCYFA